ncbi:hypothetical protein [Vibrio anguillarum]|uniref:hypothetical protein n=1 Tax=Vibrio anguillarum TaxID=55601 RepID=UPI000BB4841D|nr:hypothetical protein [Vibrio anguillarum]ATC60123.1 hypothetical protein CMV05_22240 [Vibrio anguillarum]MBF4341274.1 hypothetical protein [Vibrio anguillarum]
MKTELEIIHKEMTAELEKLTIKITDILVTNESKPLTATLQQCIESNATFLGFLEELAASHGSNERFSDVSFVDQQIALIREGIAFQKKLINDICNKPINDIFEGISTKNGEA